MHGERKNPRGQLPVSKPASAGRDNGATSRAMKAFAASTLSARDASPAE